MKEKQAQRKLTLFSANIQTSVPVSTVTKTAPHFSTAGMPEFLFQRAINTPRAIHSHAAFRKAAAGRGAL